MQDIIRQIRTRLRLSMNGVVSTSMREKGLVYKLNFGVSIPKLKEIAKETPFSASLAETIWEQDVREMKILATMLYPVNEFTERKANKWASDIIYPEIAEQYVMNLLQHLPYGMQLAQNWLTEQKPMLQLIAHLLLARLFTNGEKMNTSDEALFLSNARHSLDKGVSANLHIAIVSALKKYGLQSKEQAEKVLDIFSDYSTESAPSEKQSILEDLKFEFDYYN